MVAVGTLLSGLIMVSITAPLQLLAGDLHGINTLRHQPAKIAAMEGHFETRAGAPLLLFGVPDMDREITRYTVEIPRLGCLILTLDPDGVIKGLNEWPRSERPNAAIVFTSFRVMVGLGMLMVGLALWSTV